MDRLRHLFFVAAAGVLLAAGSANAGVCCMDDGSCQDLADVACATAGGMYMGDGTDCADTECQVVDFSFPPNLPGGFTLDFNRFNDMGGLRALEAVIISIDGTISAIAKGENNADVPADVFEVRINGSMHAMGTGLEVPDLPCLFNEIIPCPNLPVSPSDNNGEPKGTNGTGPDVCDWGFIESAPCLGITPSTSDPVLAAWTGPDTNPVTVISTGSFTLFSSTKASFNLNEFAAGGRVAVAFLYVFPTGACCLADGTCVEDTIPACEDVMGGVFQGDGTDCFLAPCLNTSQACCLPDGTCENLNLTFCMDQGGVPQGDNLACFDVECPQACCLPDGTCTLLGVVECLTMAGSPQSPGTSCDDVQCSQACCLPDGGCDVRPEADCMAAGGTPQPVGTACISVECPRACCLSDGTCDLLMEAECLAGGGLPQAEGVTCDTVACPQACCMPNGMCELLSISGCNAAGGTPQGEGVACAGMSCPEACCLPDGTCSLMAADDCVAAGGLPQGAAVACTDVECPRACCLPDGTCELMDAASCLAGGGIEQALGDTCDDVVCPQSCCMADGTCTVMDPIDCAAAGGTAQGVGQTCSQIECPQACCLPDGTCDLQEEVDCLVAGGTPQGAGVACADVQCPEACCMPNGMCELLLAADCSAAGGTPQGPGVMCVNMSCPEACCLDDGTCTLLEGPDCTAAGGTPQVAGMTCGDVECPRACCLDDGTCDLRPEADCIAAGGTPQASGMTCAMTECPQACCLEDGSCEMRTEAECIAAGGMSQPVGSTCAVTDCPRACCLEDGTCTELDEVDCVSAGGVSQPVGTTCADAECPESCCLDDGTCSLLTAADCVAAGGTPQGSGVECADVECPLACCLSDGSCSLLSAADCAAEGGTSQSGACGDVDCPQSCCLMDGTCLLIDPVDCGQSGGMPMPSGTDLADSPCPQSCCLDDGSCLMLMATECASAGGEVQPAGNTCDTARCDAACCLADGTCAADQTLDECDAMGGIYQGLGVPCDPDLCVETSERAHPGWNWVDTGARWTANQPAYWSAFTGGPGPDGRALPPFTVLDPASVASQNGRPANDGTQDRVLRGFIVAFAVDDEDKEIAHNHLKGDATIVNYKNGTAWEYNAWAFQTAMSHSAGTPLVQDGRLDFDGLEYVPAFSHLLLDFYAPGSDAFGNGVTIVDTDITLHPLWADLRQESPGPHSTKASFVIWNEDETQFTNLHRCITCWDEHLISLYTEDGIQNHFLSLQTDKGKARIDGLASQLCSSNCCFDRGSAPGCEELKCQQQVCDIDPLCCSLGSGGGWSLECAVLAVDICDECSSLQVDAPLLGVAARSLSFNSVTADISGANLIGMGTESASISYDPIEGGGNPPSLTSGTDTFDDGIPAGPARNILRTLSSMLEGGAASDPPVAMSVAGTPAGDRVSGTEKGSVVVYSKVELRWDATGNLIQDTFIDLTNDLGSSVRIKLYFVNGDPPLEAVDP